MVKKNGVKQVLIMKKKKKSVYIIFFIRKLSLELKLNYNKAKRAALFQAIHVDQISHYWRRHTSPHLTNIIISSKTG